MFALISRNFKIYQISITRIRANSTLISVALNLSVRGYVCKKYRLFDCQNMSFCEKRAFLPAFGRVGGASRALWGGVYRNPRGSTIAMQAWLRHSPCRVLSSAVGVCGRPGPSAVRRAHRPLGLGRGWSQGEASPFIFEKKQPALFGQDGLVRVGHCGFVKEVHAP